MESAVATRKVWASLLLASPGLAFSGYIAVRRAGIKFLYKPAFLDESQVFKDIPYVSSSDDSKQRLDLFLPKRSHWPIFIFVHGGGLAAGDKGLRIGGADVYGNIGRFYASSGIGVAVINYRLQPKVTWREQVADVAAATAWVYSHLGTYGADTSRLFIGGHSAGAQLATRIALDQKALDQQGLSPRILSGVIAVSGAGYDLCDARTYELGHKLCCYERRFRCGDTTDAWKTEASPISYAAPDGPPFLIFYAEKESESLQRQSQLLHEVLQSKHVPSRLIVVPAQNHSRIVLTLSRADRTSSQEILRFIKNSDEDECDAAATSSLSVSQATSSS